MEAAWQLLHNGSDAVHDRTTVEDVPMQPAVDTQTQYLQPLLCKGFTNQVLCFHAEESQPVTYTSPYPNALFLTTSSLKTTHIPSSSHTLLICSPR